MTRVSSSCLGVALLLGLATTPGDLLAQSELDGAWEVVQAVGDSIESNQPGLYIFHGNYYSVLHVWADEARPMYEEDEDRGNVDNEKLLAIVLPVEGNSGRFTMEGSTLTMTPMVAISPNFMSGLSRIYSFSLSGDELTLRGGSITDEPGAINRVLRLRRLR